ncbi:hypothetical protein B0H15DRAFT_805114 [Mycena belliarum]|uniref:Uncharacterized protein n=1 Tax=Mycena belliarum TaxID=1033014 RepID=A0AAD6TS62_9AGAR|nr:hypothetical protein B0H15DRAFT_805114 [Mycena belliae]
MNGKAKDEKVGKQSAKRIRRLQPETGQSTDVLRSETIFARLTAKQRAESHRKASAAYESRAAAKKARRKWDPPKISRSDTAVHPSQRDTQAEDHPNPAILEEIGTDLDLSAANLLTLDAIIDASSRPMVRNNHGDGNVSSVLNDALAVAALAGLAGGTCGNEDRGVDSVLDLARQLSSLGTATADIVRMPGTPSRFPLSQMVSRRVEQAQAAVARLNPPTISPLDPSDVMVWDEPRRIESADLTPMSLAAYRRVRKWCKRTGRLACNSWDSDTADAMLELAHSVPVNRMIDIIWDAMLAEPAWAPSISNDLGYRL